MSDSESELVMDEGEGGGEDKGEMGPPPKTYNCLQTGCPKRYTRVQDLLGHYNTKHRDVEVPIVIYKWRQEQDAKPRVECPYCAKFFCQNINR